MSGEAFVTLVVLGIVIMIVVFIAGRSRRSRSGHNDNLAIQAGRRVEPASAPSTAEDNVNASVSRKSYESSTPEMTITPKLQTLIRELEDPNDERRASAAREIGRLGDVGGVEPLIEALAEGQTNNVEGDIARALGDIGDPKAVEVLAQIHRCLVRAPEVPACRTESTSLRKMALKFSPLSLISRRCGTCRVP